jgi:hypothetical protein
MSPSRLVQGVHLSPTTVTSSNASIALLAQGLVDPFSTIHIIIALLVYFGINYDFARLTLA